MLKTKLYIIDTQLLLREGFVSEELVQKISNNQARVLVQRDKRKKTEKPTDDLETTILQTIGAELLDLGYEWIGYSTEFIDTPMQAIGYRWESFNKDLTVVFPNNGPPLLVFRNTEKDGQFDMYKKNPGSKTNFNIPLSIKMTSLNKFISFEGYLLDEMTRKTLHTTVRTPRPDKMDLDENTQVRMRGFIHNRIGKLESQL